MKKPTRKDRFLRADFVEKNKQLDLEVNEIEVAGLASVLSHYDVCQIHNALAQNSRECYEGKSDLDALFDFTLYFKVYKQLERYLKEHPTEGISSPNEQAESPIDNWKQNTNFCAAISAVCEYINDILQESELSDYTLQAAIDEFTQKQEDAESDSDENVAH